MTLAEALLATHTQYNHWAAHKSSNDLWVEVRQGRFDQGVWAVWWHRPGQERTYLPAYFHALHEIELYLAFVIITSPRKGWLAAMPLSWEEDGHRVYHYPITG